MIQVDEEELYLILLAMSSAYNGNNLLEGDEELHKLRYELAKRHDTQIK